MRTRRPSRRNSQGLFGGWTGIGRKPNRGPLTRAPRRRDIELLEPRQMLTTVGTPTDEPYFEDQWHLQATGQNVEFNAGSPTFGQQEALLDINVVPAWELGVSGAGTQIVIVDGGFDLTHEDLVFLPGVDLFGGDTDPTFTDITDASGTQIAGIIGARDNGIGTVGVAYEADLIPIRLNPGDADLGLPTIEAINSAFRFQAGLISDLDGDGVPDSSSGGALIPVDLDGDGTIDGFGEDPSLVTDVFFHSSDFVDDRLGEGVNPRTAAPLPTEESTLLPGSPTISILQAIEETALAGRSLWVDADGDGLLDQDEIQSLGAIHVVGAGDDAGFDTTQAGLSPTGSYASSQYSQLANSPYTIAVGGLDYDGAFENNATGTITSIFEGGANVLVTAPTGVTGTDIGFSSGLDAGIVTTDPTGDLGSNLAGIPNFEFDGDYFADTNYTSLASGSDFAAAQVAGVISLMLEANPLLSYRDVQQILLQSAQTNDQFNESWITNQIQLFQDPFVVNNLPQYALYDLDTDGDGEADIEDAIIPNTQSPDVVFGYFLNPANIDLGVPFVFDPENPGIFVDTTGVVLNEPDPEADPPVEPAYLTIVGSNVPMVENPDPDTGEFFIGPDGEPQDAEMVFTPAPVVIFAEDSVPDNASSFFLNSPVNTDGIDLVFENGAGFTVSQGYGNNLEDFSYAHGVVDAELAVELALAWDTNDLYLDDQVLLTSDVLGAPGTTFAVQPRATVIQNDVGILQIPGGLSTEPIDLAFYNQFFSEIETTEVEAGGGDFPVLDPDTGEPVIDPETGEPVTVNVPGEVIGEVITGAPFDDPEDFELDADRGFTALPLAFDFDPSVDADFLSLEWIEVTVELSAGDIDNLRLSIISPDGTQSELNPYRPEVEDTDIVTPPPQDPQGKQGRIVPSDEAIGPTLGPIPLNPDQVITGTDVVDLEEVDTPDALGQSEAWTWTTNRHWGELFSLQANSTQFGPDGSPISPVVFDGGTALINPEFVSSDDQWLLVVENYGDSFIEIGTQIEVSVLGTEVSGNRIQGKVGVDDNAQGIDGIDGDENFNFDRYVEFADLNVLVDTGEVALNPETMELEPVTTTLSLSAVLDDVSDSVTYTNTQASPAGDPELVGEELDLIYRTVAPDTGVEILYPVIDRDSYFDIDIAGIAPSLENFVQTTVDPAFTVLGVGYATQSISTPSEPLSPFVEVPFSYQNFDYSQEGFSAGTTVVATQFEVIFDGAGNVVDRVATGVVDKFTTGADGNYYFDVEANPEPPAPGTPAYDAWFVDFGSLFEYEISLEGVDSSRILTNEDGGGIGYFDLPETGFVNFDTGTLSYNVAINAADDILLGETTKTTNINFLLTQDPAETAGTATGQVFTDFNNDGIFNGADEAVAGVTVFVDLDLSGDVTAGDITAVTDVNGNYALVVPNVTDGQVVTVTVVESTLPDEREFLSPATGSQTVTLAQGASSFANFTLNPEGVLPGQSAVISGEVFEDLDGDGVSDPGEPPLTPIRVFIDSNGNGVFDDDLDGNPATTDAEISAITTATGAFTLSLPTGGVFDVMIDFGFGEAFAFTQTTPAAGAPITVPVASGGVATGLQFGLTDLRTQDFGDLGGPYPTLAADDGPRHELVPSVFLGSVAPDAELDGQPTSTANGDNTNGANDEDGVTLITPLVQGGVIVDTLEFDILANGQNAVLNGWIDFDNSGSFEADEQIFTDTSLVSGTTNRVSAAVPSDTVIASSYAARFRWGPFGLGPTGAANAGEVEDYVFPASGTTPLGSTDGDYNSDGTVDQGDELTWQSDFGATSGEALRSDGNGDGVVNLFDYIFWREAYESQPPTLADPPATGDYNGDGSVDGDDHTAFADAHGSTVDPGTGADGNGDGAVNAADFVVWREAEASQSAPVSLLTDPGPETTPAVASMSVFVDALAVVTPQAVAVAPVVDSALEVAAPTDDAEADSDAVDLALLQLAAGDAVVEADEAAAEATPLAEEDEGESIELALDEGLIVAI